VRHPYRDPEPTSVPRVAERTVDTEELAVHSVLALTGGLGVAVGVAATHPRELTLGFLLAGAAIWKLVGGLRSRPRAVGGNHRPE
jgi:hypothetical protein